MINFFDEIEEEKQEIKSSERTRRNGYKYCVYKTKNNLIDMTSKEDRHIKHEVLAWALSKKEAEDFMLECLKTNSHKLLSEKTYS